MEKKLALTHGDVQSSPRAAPSCGSAASTALASAKVKLGRLGIVLVPATSSM